MEFNIVHKLAKLIRILQLSKSRHALFLHRVASSVEHESLLKGLKLNFIVDIGANRGQFALIASEIFPNAYIHSFEPLKKPADRFERIFRNNTRVVLHRVALGNCASIKPMHVSKRDDSSSLLPITSLQEEVFPGTSETAIQNVKVDKLRNIIRPSEITRPSLLKIDVQGYEFEVLEGCDDILENFDYIYIECSFLELYKNQILADEVIASLHDKNFRLVGTYNAVYDGDGRSIQTDFLFTRH
jgi:FkbM family methyltransferase